MNKKDKRFKVRTPKPKKNLRTCQNGVFKFNTLFFTNPKNTFASQLLKCKDMN